MAIPAFKLCASRKDLSRQDLSIEISGAVKNDSSSKMLSLLHVQIILLLFCGLLLLIRGCAGVVALYENKSFVWENDSFFYPLDTLPELTTFFVICWPTLLARWHRFFRFMYANRIIVAAISTLYAFCLAMSQQRPHSTHSLESISIQTTHIAFGAISSQQCLWRYQSALSLRIS